MRIYLDHNATTPVHASARDAMVRTLTQEAFGNPSSVHYYGQRAKSSVDDARALVAMLLNADPGDVIFTSGGTESDNLALRGALESRAAEPRGRRHLVTSAIEHEAVLNTARSLEKQGWPVSIIPVGSSGIVDPADIANVVTKETALVSLMHANNEVGTIQPILEAAAIAKNAGAWFHTDAVQSAGKLPILAREWASIGVDLISISAHKFGGPKGVGALWIRRGVRLSPTATGGRHERNRRAGTENVSGIAGFGAAARTARESFANPANLVNSVNPANAANPGNAGNAGNQIAALRDRLESAILATVEGTVVNGDPSRRLPNTSNISFDGVEAESLLIALDLDHIAVSTGAACSSGTLEPSHVLTAMGLPHPRTKNSLRFSLGPENTAEEIERVIAALPPLVEKLRRLTRAVAAR